MCTSSDKFLTIGHQMRSVLQPPKQSQIPKAKAKPPIQIQSISQNVFQVPGKSSQKKIMEFRERFQKLRFYFDGVDQAMYIKLKSLITKLGGHIDTFLSFQVTHIITGNPDVKEGTQRSYHENPKLKASMPDIVLIAEHLQVKVWPPSSKII
jgi:hypothetical protein